jgi:ABC-type molybdenum transport system ATPase subunit/photorepair protein PhrA
MTHADDLRAWARGSYTTEAATELMLKAFKGRFAAIGNPRVHAASTTPEGYQEHAWIDFAAIPEEAGALSGGERRFLMLAASLAEDVPVVLGEVVPGLDRDNLDLVLAAIAHAGGSHQHSDICFNEDGSMSRGKGYLDSLHPWPRTLRSV